MAAVVSYLSARNGISAVASDFLRFKSQTLVDYMEGQWDLLTDNDLESDEEYISAAEGAMKSFAASLIRSETELVLALDSDGNVVMSAPPIEARLGPYPDLLLGEGETAKWNGSLQVGERRRVAHIDRFTPLGWTVLVTEAWDTFYQPVTRISLLIGIIGIVTLVIAVIFLVIATGLIAKPLEGMADTIEEMMNTMDLKTRVPIVYSDETGRLAHSFNQMTDSLDKANDDIKDFALRAVFAHRQAEKAREDADNARKEAEKAKIREHSLRVLFQKFVPQSVIDLNMSRKGAELRDGTNQLVSILMSDIRNFTTITENMAPDTLVDSLNRYFEAMVDVVDDQGGIVDKYIGDAVMALFGAPRKEEGDVLRSVFAGLEMLSALDIFNADQEARGLRPFNIGIGIHYGNVTAGNIGSDKKMEYTVIGGSVNLASRLEGLTKYYGVPLIISETVKTRVEKDLEVRLLDKIIALGSDLRMPIYSVTKELSEEKMKAWETIGIGQKAYYDRNFPGAQKHFQDALKAYPDDKVSRIFLERTLGYLKDPPPDGWDGYFVHKSK